jgi:ribosomal peptide maturation radical SAM protein 1
VQVPLSSGRSSETRSTVPTVRVALVNVPFAYADRPSIQCGVLKSALTAAGHDVNVYYLNLLTAAEIGADTYSSLAAVRTDQFVGEWLFTAAAFGSNGNEEDYRAACPGLDETCDFLGIDFVELCRLRSSVMPRLVDRWAREIDWGRYAVVGFTSTFEQNVAALALARRVKAAHPDVRVVFGGANFDGGMGLEFARVFPWIDYAVVGEGDRVFPALVGQIAGGDVDALLPGVVARRGDDVASGPPPRPITDMDALPDPNFDEYFGTLFALGRERVLGDAPPRLLFESSRGCWWGKKHHCTFCGLNNNGMAFRSKSPPRVMEELRRLSGRYQITDFEAVDNIIDLSYLKELCPSLVEQHLDYTIFYEVKSNLTRASLHMLARAGIRRIQPGIESLSSHVLSIMRKGTSMLLNIRFLRWATYYRMQVGWNLLTGFPGETADDYAAQEKLLPLLAFVQPPHYCGPIWLERFSPYFFDDELALKGVRPRRAYDFIYPVDNIDRSEIAYFFDYEAPNEFVEPGSERLRALVADWQDRWKAPVKPALVYRRAPDWIQIVDRRRPDEPAVHALHGLDAAIYEACSETDRTPARVARELASSGWSEPSAAVIEDALERFCAHGLAVQEDGRFLSLALPANPNWR